MSADQLGSATEDSRHSLFRVEWTELPTSAAPGMDLPPAWVPIAAVDHVAALTDGAGVPPVVVLEADSASDSDSNSNSNSNSDSDGARGDANDNVALALTSRVLEIVQAWLTTPGMDAAQAVTWRERVYRDERVASEERPRYLLMLGSPEQVSFELQHVLAQGAFVGRLHFATPEGRPDLASHGAYVDKVLAHEHASEQAEAADVLPLRRRQGD